MPTSYTRRSLSRAGSAPGVAANLRKSSLCILSAALILTGAFPISALGGALTAQFRQGYEGVRWGTGLSALEASRPGGKVSTGIFPMNEALATYQLPDERPLFGVSRPHMKVSYGICLDNVKVIRLYFPSPTRDELLVALNREFGRFRVSRSSDSTQYYEWLSDGVLRLSMQVTLTSITSTVIVSVMNEKEEYCANPDCGLPTPQFYGQLD